MITDSNRSISYSVEIYAVDLDAATGNSVESLLLSSSVRGSNTRLTNALLEPSTPDNNSVDNSRTPENPATLDNTFVHIFLGLSFATAGIFGYRRLPKR